MLLKAWFSTVDEAKEQPYNAIEKNEEYDMKSKKSSKKLKTLNHKT